MELLLNVTEALALLGCILLLFVWCATALVALVWVYRFLVSAILE